MNMNKLTRTQALENLLIVAKRFQLWEKNTLGTNRSQVLVGKQTLENLFAAIRDVEESRPLKNFIDPNKPYKQCLVCGGDGKAPEHEQEHGITICSKCNGLGWIPMFIP